MASYPQDFELGIAGYYFSDLYRPERLASLHNHFWDLVSQSQPGLKAHFEAMHAAAQEHPVAHSIALIDVASHYGRFLERLFRVEAQAEKIRATTHELQPVFRFKNEFLKIRVFNRLDAAPCDDTEFARIDRQVQNLLKLRGPGNGEDPETRFARLALFLLDCHKTQKKQPLEPTALATLEALCADLPGATLAERNDAALAVVQEWCVQKYVDPKRRKGLAGWVSYTRPHKLDFENLVPRAAAPSGLAGHSVFSGPLRPRDGFKLTDSRMDTKQVLREIDYCLYCHQREKDSCRKGFDEKEGGFKKNPLGIELKGCPLDERISEMHFLRKQGDAIAALAMITLDNPMCPGTGHRICNDCMKGCIFQKQDPVNIPENETGILTEVLALPYGFEIYGLLTRLNPLNLNRPYALPYNGKNVLVVGLGPAGYTLSHYLAAEGFGVVGIDGLKIEPLPDALTGRGQAMPQPVRSYSELKEELDSRILRGFGGVSEYGITVRWDKNFLTLIYLTLARHWNTRFYGGVRFGGTLDLDDAWELGFEHVALATGAGKPTLVQVKNNLARGVRQASDLLMSLQLTGAFKKDSLSNLQVQLPAVVIGGGLTALDTATETLAYYPVQVEKILSQFESLRDQLGEEKAWALTDQTERRMLETFLEHGRAVRQERERASQQGRPADFTALCREWGGVHVAYRKRLIDSPAYRLNHEEVTKAFEEGIGFVENVTPLEIELDSDRAARALVCRTGEGETIRLPARTVVVAAGTQPNTIYEREHPGVFAKDAAGRYFQAHRITPKPGDGAGFALAPVAPGEGVGFFLSYENRGRFVSFYGDNHPEYAGNVVKAMASAKHGAPQVARLFADPIARAERGEDAGPGFKKLVAQLDEWLVPKVVQVNRLTPTIVEVIVKGRYAARKFEPGQFYRLQNYETLAPSSNGYRLAVEGLALTGAWVDKANDLLSMVVLEMGASSKLCALLQRGEPVVVMGPTGAPSEIPQGETVVLVGGGLGNAVLLSISQALKAQGCTVLYFAGYRQAADLFFQKQIAQATDQMVWAVDGGTKIEPTRPQDISFQGNIVEAMLAYAQGKLGGSARIDLAQADRILAIGSDRMMAAVAAARHGVLKPYLKETHTAIGSINSPMQCMLKEVCAQCLQKHIDPATGKESFVFSCFNQDQLLDHVDFANLRDRLGTNALQEKLTHRIVDKILDRTALERV